jgi:hypothetical protein
VFFLLGLMPCHCLSARRNLSSHYPRLLKVFRPPDLTRVVLSPLDYGILDAAVNKRLRELMDLIATAQDDEVFSKLVAELNQILDEQKSRKPPE